MIQFLASTSSGSRRIYLALVVTSSVPNRPRWFVFAHGLRPFPVEDLGADVRLTRG